MVIGTASLLFCSLLGFVDPPPDDEARDVIKRAIKAHGGEEKIAKSLTGKLSADATFSFAPNVEGKITWEESFELPRRYKRVIKGTFQNMSMRMEYAITGGSGWIRKGDGPIEDFKGEALPLNRSWNATLATLAPLLAKDVKLSKVDGEKISGEDAVGIKETSAEAESVLYFSRKTGLLLKAKRLMQHPLTGKEAAGEVVFSDYKEIAGVQYPHRVTSYVGSKKLIELQISKIEFLKSLDDRLFEKPKDGSK